VPQNAGMARPVHHVAILGSGISGLAAASLLRLRGQDVTVYEKFAAPRPLGSGLVLHRTGLAVLAELGLDREAIRLGCRLTRFEGRTVGGRRVFDLAHDPGEFSLGLHRHAAFELLHGKALALGVRIETGCEVDTIEQRAKTACVMTGSRRAGEFDLVIDASGAHSIVRDKHARIRNRRSFAYGALWGVCEAPEGLPLDVLRQRFQGAKVGIGLIPIGQLPNGDGTRHIGFHWSVRNSAVDAWRRAPISEWKRDVELLWPETRFLTAQIHRHDDMTWAAYEDVALASLCAGRIAFIGDAAHSISPRLGQGANLGLVDALVLANTLAESTDVPGALQAYDARRRGQVRFYHAASRWLSTLFQSDRIVAPFLRDLAFAPVSHIPFMRRQMLDSLSGVKTGLFGRLEMPASARS
jgi:salicylate hydroxylase